MTTSILDKTFRTSDGRLLFVTSNTSSNSDNLIIVLGNIGRFPFEGKNWEKLKQKEGGGNETEVVRKAIDEFIQSRQSKFGYLQGMAVGFWNQKELYLEISARGTGKTYRLIKDATRYLEEDSKNKVNIVTVTNHQAKRIKQLIGEYFKNLIYAAQHY